MRNKTYIILLLVCSVFCMSCGKRQETVKGKLLSEMTLTGDSTLYGLACEGCNDSVLVFMSFDGSDPVTYDIYKAFRHHKVFGRLETGDWVAVVLNQQDSTVADMVINLDELKGTWCYTVMPKLRDSENMPKDMRDKIVANMPDSVRELYFVPREYGFTLQRHYQASSVGHVGMNTTFDEDSPVEYPALPVYTAWRILNGRLVLIEGERGGVGDSVKNVSTRNDTIDIIFMRDDSLVLSHKGTTQSYYRRANAAATNTAAKAAVAKQAKQALEEVKE